MRYSLAVTAMLAGPILCAAWWANSDSGATYRAEQEARRQCVLIGAKCDTAVRKPRKPKTDECVASTLTTKPDRMNLAADVGGGSSE